jgi:hypothetical protein
MVKLKFFLMESTKGIISEIDKILSEVLVKLAKILNLFSS